LQDRPAPCATIALDSPSKFRPRTTRFSLATDNTVLSGHRRHGSTRTDLMLFRVSPPKRQAVVPWRVVRDPWLDVPWMNAHGISDPDRDCGARDSVHRAAHRADLRVADTAAPHGSPHRSRSDRGAAAGRDRGLERARPAALARHAGSRRAAAAGGTDASARAGRRARGVRAGTGRPRGAR